MEQVVPKLRFPEFVGSWKKKNIGSLGSFFSGGTPTSTNKTYYEGQIPFIGSGKINDSTVDQFITDEALSNSSAKLVEIGDLLYALYGATSGEVAISKINGAINQAVLCIRTDENKIFLKSWFEKNKENILSTFLQGGQGNLSAQIVKSLIINLPLIQEQTKIASFLTAVDEKLTALKQKKTLLEQYKKGVMQKIFSKELRFKDDNGNEYPDWEETKVKDIFVVTRGNVLSMTLVTNEQDENNLFPVYSSQTKNNGLSGYYDKFLFEDCITWTTDGAGAGDVNFRKGKFYCTNVCGVLKSDKGYANTFVAEILNSVSRKYVSYVGNPKLMNNVMSEIQISIPTSIEEQTKIATFLSAIDDKINHCQVQIGKTEVWKNGLLQQMFC